MYDLPRAPRDNPPGHVMSGKPRRIRTPEGVEIDVVLTRPRVRVRRRRRGDPGPGEVYITRPRVYVPVRIIESMNPRQLPAYSAALAGKVERAMITTAAGRPRIVEYAPYDVPPRGRMSGARGRTSAGTARNPRGAAMVLGAGRGAEAAVEPLVGEAQVYWTAPDPGDGWEYEIE